MYVCGEYVAHLYMIVLVMNDQTKLKLLYFFACKRPMADGRQTKISDHLAAPMSPSFNVGTPMYNNNYCGMCGTIEQKNYQPPYPPYPRFNVVEVAAGILKNDNIEAGAWG